MSFAEFQEMYTGNINFLQFSGLIATIKKHKQQNNKTIIKDFNIRYPSTIELIFKSKKGCKEMYDVLISKNKCFPTSEKKWAEKGINLSRKEWEKAYLLPFKTTSETKLQWFQFQMLHRLSATNYYLNKCGIKDSPLCSYCNQLPETLDHLFSECAQIKELWIDIENWLKSALDIDINTNRNSILFGKINNLRLYRLENLIILTIKYYIYTNKFTPSKNLNIETLKQYLINRFYVEKFILLKNCKFNEFNKCLKSAIQKIEHSS